MLRSSPGVCLSLEIASWRFSTCIRQSEQHSHSARTQSRSTHSVTQHALSHSARTQSLSTHSVTQHALSYPARTQSLSTHSITQHALSHSARTQSLTSNTVTQHAPSHSRGLSGVAKRYTPWTSCHSGIQQASRLLRALHLGHVCIDLTHKCPV